MNHVSVFIELKKQDLDQQFLREEKVSKRLRNYLIAIDMEETEKHWDLRACYKKRMSWNDFYKKWGSKKMKRSKTIVVTEDSEIFVSSSEKDHVICPVCLASNTVLDLKCRNCGKTIVPNNAIIVPNKEE